MKLQPEQPFEGRFQIMAKPIEPMAERMLADPKLANDEMFRAFAKERLRWFYSKTPFIDER